MILIRHQSQTTPFEVNLLSFQTKYKVLCIIQPLCICFPICLLPNEKYTTTELLTAIPAFTQKTKYYPMEGLALLTFATRHLTKPEATKSKRCTCSFVKASQFFVYLRISSNFIKGKPGMHFCILSFSTSYSFLYDPHLSKG